MEDFIHPMTIELLIGQIEHSCSIYGPYERTVIWTQGCTLGCKGCWNKDLWPQVGGKPTAIEDIINAAIAHGDEGITILGGEPLQQLEATLALIQLAKEHDLGVFLYTGYERNELDEKGLLCLELSDIVVTGRYVQSLRNTNLRWRGSSNQEVHFSSKRYDTFLFEEENEIQITLEEDGRLTVLGYPGRELLNDLLDGRPNDASREHIGPSSQPSSD
jgi:anaerobic ribonucleoside-triphosphate reductase activating protein